ncbi:hypothetical protein LCGC14_0615210 [marine sediment metagenome]|uniref:Uncharacterized protein n=1 Tax=marine sediment metagenome TaxID=412755 RepID=A0A0F9TSR7_9ZZZZ|nr:hypothetical protein [Pricia sp.]HEC64631.1 hypothetical protein [bacterium]
MSTKLQERAVEIIRKNPEISRAKALIMAGYSDKTALNPTANVIGSKGFANLQDVYQYELVRKGINLKFLAKKMKEGLTDKDKKVVALYHDKAEKALELSKESVDTAVQINLGSELTDLAE